MFQEIDYILEGQNAERFAVLYGCKPCKFFSNLKGTAFMVVLFCGNVLLASSNFVRFQCP